MRTSLNVNIAANLAARGWNALMSFVFVPVYLHFIGAEGYGFISLYTTLVALFALLDFGLALTANREIARFGTQPDERAAARTLLRTFEAVYWAIAAIVAAAIFAMAGFVVTHWITLHTVPVDQAKRGVQLMALVALVRWPVSLYVGALQGMQRQVSVNVITSLAATAAGAGAIAILWLVAPRVDLFVGWQLVVFAVQVAVLRWAAWRGLALPGNRPRVTLAALRDSAGFSIGITGITLLSLVLTQLDKLLLTRMLSLKEFGYYSIAASLAGLLTTAGGAVQTAAFPALTASVARGDAAETAALYHKSSRMLAVLVIPVALTLALFAPQLLRVYLGNAELAANTQLLLALLALGNACIALEFMPLSLQLANGWTSLSVWKNVVAVALYVPLLLYLVPRFGAAGAALSWLALTAGYLFIEVPIMHRRLLRGALGRWYASDLGKPFAITAGLMGLTWLLLPASLAPLPAFIVVALAGFVTQGCCLLLLPETLGLLRGFSATGAATPRPAPSKDSSE